MEALTRVAPILIVTIFLTSLVMVPSVFVFGGNPTLTNLDATPESQALLSQMPHDARVAIYNEANTTVPVGAAIQLNNSFTNNLNEIQTILDDAGHSVALLDEQDILDHQLITANYDVFVLVNNVPRESIANLVSEFWLGGGGLLTFNRAFSYLNYQNIIWPDLGLDGYGILWGNQSANVMNVTERHPTMTAHHINDTITERVNDWAVIVESVFDGSPVWDSITPLLRNITQPNYLYGFAMNDATGSNKEGGRIVHLPGDGLSIPTDFESIIVDSVEWLIPRPKGRIAFDLSHWPRISVDPWDVEFATTYIEPNVFTQFRTLAVNHSYTFDKLYPSSIGNLTAERLANYDVLIIDWPDVNYTAAEYSAVEEWVDGGGSLLVLGDRTGLGGDGYIYINTMLQNFDMSLGTTNVLDYTTCTPGTHVTLEGCTSLSIAYRNYLSVIGSADTIWLESGNPVVASQDFGQGRAILVGDMNIFDDGQLALTDNRHFALNVLNWLTANDAEILVHTDYLGWRDAPCLALNDLGLPYQLFTTRDYLDDFLDSKEWGLLIYNAVNYLQELTILDELYAYVDSGGKLIMTYFAVDDDPTHPLWSKVGVEFSSTLSGNPSMYVWDASHPIFSEPNDHGLYNYTSNGFFADDGDAVTVRSGYTALAGTTGDIQDGSAAIVVGSDKQTLFNSFVIDNFGTDEDDSTYADSIELWENEITYMMPSGGGGFQFPLDATTLAIIGAAVGGLIIIGVVASRRRGGGSTPKSKPKKKSTKKKK